MVAAGIGASGSDDVEGNGFADGTGVGELGENVECGAATAMRLGMCCDCTYQMLQCQWPGRCSFVDLSFLYFGTFLVVLITFSMRKIYEMTNMGS